jgi:hypothetical protein
MSTDEVFETVWDELEPSPVAAAHMKMHSAQWPVGVSLRPALPSGLQ